MVATGLIPIDIALIFIVSFILVVLATKTGQPTIMAYIVAGLILGPVFLDIVEGSNFIDLLVELGLPLLLFLVGLEMKFNAFKSILSRVGKIAAGQIAAQQFLAFLVAYLLGFGLFESFILSMCTIFGATPIVVKMLNDKNEISSMEGRIDVGTLILQDIYLVVVLAFLAAGEISGAYDVIYTLGRVILLSMIIGSASFLGAKILEKEILGDLSSDKHAFFIHGVAWALLFIALSNHLGLSMEIGGFLAGLGLGQLPYSKELEEKIRPLTNFFIVVFFAGIGLTLDSGQLFAHWEKALIAVVVLSFSAFWVMYELIRWQGFSIETSFKGSINLTMVSEFSLVAGALALENNMITAGMLGYLTLMKLVTNGYATYLIQYNDQIFQRFKPYLMNEDDEERTDNEGNNYEAVVLGNSEIDELVRPILDEEFEKIVFVESDPHEMKKLKQEGEEFIFGDPRHPEIRRDSGMNEAEIVVSLEEDFDLDKFLAETLETDSIALTDDKADAKELTRLGADHVIIKDDAIEEILKEKIEEVLR